MAESSDVLINAGVFGVLLPAVAAGVGGAIGRVAHPLARGAAGLGVAGGV